MDVGVPIRNQHGVIRIGVLIEDSPVANIDPPASDLATDVNRTHQLRVQPSDEERASHRLSVSDSGRTARHRCVVRPEIRPTRTANVRPLKSIVECQRVVFRSVAPTKSPPRRTLRRPIYRILDS